MIKMIGDGGLKLGKDAWSISVVANIAAHVESKPLSQALRDGWKTLRFHHPSIASTADEDILEYHTPDPLELNQWVDESFVVVEDGISPGDIIAGLRPRRWATLYYMRERANILLHLSHWRTDGIGAFQLMNAYLEAVIKSLKEDPLKLPWGEEAARLVPSVEEALKLPHTSSPDIVCASKQYLDTLANNIGALGTPYKSEAGLVPTGTRGVLLRFSQEMTTQFEIKCHELGIEMKSAVHAAVAATAYSIAEPTSKHKHHSSTMRQSIRSHLQPPYDSVAGASGLYTAGYIVKVPATQTWLENAKQYQVEYSKGATDDLLCSRRQYARAMQGILKNMPQPDTPPSGLDFSFVPDVQALVKPVYAEAAESLEVRDVGIGVDVISRHLYVFMWTFNSQLVLRLVYNEAFYDVAFAENVLAVVKEHLVSNLVSSPL